MPEKQCIACQAKMDADAIFCNECGHAGVATFAEVERPDEAKMRLCSSCGQATLETSTFCSRCGVAKTPVSVAFVPAVSEVSPPLAPFIIDNSVTPQPSFSPALINAVKRRYRDGYIYGRFLNGFGGLVVGVGLFIILCGVVAALAFGGAIESSSRNSFMQSAAGVGVASGFLIGSLSVVFGGIFVVFGTIIRAGAQHLIASFDGAVNSSPFLSDMDRAEMMSLPTGSASVTVDSYDLQSSNQNLKAAAAYGLSFILGIFWIVVPICLFFMTSAENRLVRFHSLQAIFLNLFVLVLTLSVSAMNAAFQSNSLAIVNVVIFFAALATNLFCLWKAYQGEEFRLPIVGDIAIHILGNREGQTAIL